MTKQYARLDQSDREVESASYIVKPEENGAARKRSCCLSTFIVFAVVVMFAGGIAIVVGIFFTPQVNTLIDNYWKPDLGNDTSNYTALPITNSTVIPPTLEHVLVETTAGNNSTLTEVPTTTPLPGVSNDTSRSGESKENVTVTQTGQPTDTPPVSSPGEEEDLEEEDSEEEDPEEEEEETTTLPPATTTRHPKHHSKHRHQKTQESNEDESGGIDGSEILDDAEEEFASWMIRLERFLEKSTGIHRPELVVPLFMVLCFFVSMTMACCCCYVMAKRRDSRRRRILGKIITDLQTGDSKSVLLGHDGDD